MVIMKSKIALAQTNRT